MFGQQLRTARRAHGLTQGDLADRLGVTQPVISRWERGRSRPSPVQLVALQELLGAVDTTPPTVRQPELARPPAREPDRLPLPLDSLVWQRPGLTGDIALIAGLPRDDVLLAVIDTVGRGPTAALAAQHLRGWLYGWIASRKSAVRLDELVEDLGRELRLSRLDATWFLAVLGRADSPHAVKMDMASHAFPAPLLLTGPEQETRPTRTSEDPGQGAIDISHVHYETVEAPFRLVIATDGLLARLGSGSERRGKRSMLRWKVGGAREYPPEEHFGSGEAGDDETLVQLSWGEWDEEVEFDAADSSSRHQLLRDLGRSIRERWGSGYPVDPIVNAACEAVANVTRHAYSPSGPVRARWRFTRDWAQLEIADEGVGGPIREQGGYRVMRHHADVVDHWEHMPSGRIVFLGFKRREEDKAK